jgi:hypothetical protein
MPPPRLALALSRNAVASELEQDGSAQNHSAPSPRQASTTSPRGPVSLIGAALDRNASSDKRFSMSSLQVQLELLKLKSATEVLMLRKRCCPFARDAGSNVL